MDKFRDFLRKRRSGSHILSIVAGGYMLYLAYGLFFDGTEKDALIYFFAAVFVIFGLAATLTSVYALAKGYFLEQVQSDMAESREREEEESSASTDEE